MLADVLSLVLSNMQHTRSLLNMRRTCRQAWKALSVELIMGMSVDRSRLFFEPIISNIGVARSVGAAGLTPLRQRAACVVWNHKLTNLIELNQYSYSNTKWQRDFSFEATTPASTYLWVFVSADGVLCTLSAADDGNRPLIFTALRLGTDGLMMCTTISRRLLMQSATDIKPDSLLFASWANRSFLIVLPCNEHRHKIGVLELDSEHERWEWWEVSVVVQNQDQLQMGPMYQIENYVFVMPLGGTALFLLDLAIPVPRPQLALYHALPQLPTHVTAMKVSNNYERVLAYSPSANTLYSVTQSHAHVLTHERLNSFFFAGDDAAVVFHEDANVFRVYNLRHNDLVRECRLDHVPVFVFLDDALWTIDAFMRVRKLARASEQADPKAQRSPVSA